MKSAGESPSPVEKHTSNYSSRDETLSFLKSLPEVHKPKPKPERSALDEHLAFLNSLPRINSQSVAYSPGSMPEPVLGVPSDCVPDKTPPKKKKNSRKVKKRSHQQVMKEEKNRLEKERAEAKRIEVQKRRQEADERERRIALEQERANHEAILKESEINKATPKRSIFKKLVGA